MLAGPGSSFIPLAFIVNKRALIDKIIAHLAAERDLATRAARAAHAESTHEQSKADNKYDTRGLEASYLAHGQARQAEEIGEAILRFESLAARAPGPQETVDLGALVEVDRRGEVERKRRKPKRGGDLELRDERPEVIRFGRELIEVDRRIRVRDRGQQTVDVVPLGDNLHRQVMELRQQRIAAGIDREATVARLTPEIIEKALSTRCESFTVGGRRPEFDLPFDGRHVFLSGDGCGVFRREFDVDMLGLFQDLKDVGRLPVDKLRDRDALSRAINEAGRCAFRANQLWVKAK